MKITQELLFKYFVSSVSEESVGGHGNQLFTNGEHLLSHSGNLY